MRITEDDMQNAWVALLERGGPSSVDRPKSWLRATARALHGQEVQRQMKEEKAAYEAIGIFVSPVALRLAAYEKARWQNRKHDPRRLAVGSRYGKSEKGRATRRRYEHTPEARAKRAEWARNKRAKLREARLGVCNDVRSDGRTNGGDGA